MINNKLRYTVLSFALLASLARSSHILCMEKEPNCEPKCFVEEYFNGFHEMVLVMRSLCCQPVRAHKGDPEALKQVLDQKPESGRTLGQVRTPNGGGAFFMTSALSNKS